MKLLNWNVEGRVQTTLGRQIQAVLDREPDIITLQEVTRNSWADWTQGLEEAGFSVISNRELLEAPYPAPPYPKPPFPRGIKDRHIGRSRFNLTASRYTSTRLDGLRFTDPDEAKYSFPEKHLAVEVD